MEKVNIKEYFEDYIKSIYGAHVPKLQKLELEKAFMAGCFVTAALPNALEDIEKQTIEFNNTLK